MKVTLQQTKNWTTFGWFFFFIISIVLIIYWPNLNGQFLLDDWPNLDGLKQIKKKPSWESIRHYVLNDTSGRLGRPVSVFSFALQAESWPQNPSAFKLLNLAIHLLNGGLVYLLCKLLNLQTTLSSHQSKLFPLIVSGLWMIQPIHVSTVLYTVQRMTLLMALFSLLSMCGYLAGRALCHSRMILGYVIGTSSLVLFGTLAVLSKENGILIILYIAVIEATLLSNQTSPKHWRHWLWLFIFLPIILGGLYFLSQMQGFINGHSGRHFTLTEHLLTENRVLIDYITKILFPRPNHFGLFFDDYTVSKSFFAPVSTLYCFLVLVTLIVSAFYLRKTQPVYSFAVFWFLTGLSLESSFIPLELYFEHRNYLPAFGILFTLCYYFAKLLNLSSANYVKLTFIAFTVIYLLGIASISFFEAKLWSNPIQQAFTWQKNHPNSKRANALAAQTWINLGHPTKADQYLKHIATIDKRDIASHLMRLEIHCFANHLTQNELESIINQLKSSKVEFATITTASNIVKHLVSGNCSEVSNNYIETILLALKEHNINSKLKVNLVSTMSLFYAYENRYSEAIGILDEGFKQMPQFPILVLMKIRWGIASQQYEKALQWIRDARKYKDFPYLKLTDFNSSLDILQRDIKKIQASSL